MPRFVMILSYDGNSFYGWQVQKHQRTVQSALEKALLDYCGVRTAVTGSGRTDTGVHALRQYAHFDYDGNANPEQLRKGLRRHLPDDIQILKIIPVADDFHARYDAYERHYRYLITKQQTPFNRLYRSAFPRKKIRFDLMQRAAPLFLGRHDFSSFSKPNAAVPDHVCEVKVSEFEIRDDCYIYTIKADRFLHNMVRRIVGAMINISHMQLDPAIITKWIEEQNPKQTIIYPAPPQGLYLVDVLYPEGKLKLDR